MKKSELGMKPCGRNHPYSTKKQAEDENEGAGEPAGVLRRTLEADIGQWRVPFGESREGGFSEAVAQRGTRGAANGRN